MAAPPTRPARGSRSCFPELGRGWLGVLMVTAGLGTAWLAPVDPGAPALAQFAFAPPKGHPGMRVLLEGEGVGSARAVRFGDVLAAFRPAGDGRIEARVPAGADSAPITLVTDTGQVYTSGAVFQVLPGRPGPPAISSFWPAGGPPGTEVSLTGTGLQAVEGVTVAGRSAEFTPVSDHALVVTVPQGVAGPGVITVATPFGAASTGNVYRPMAAIHF